MNASKSSNLSYDIHRFRKAPRKAGTENKPRLNNPVVITVPTQDNLIRPKSPLQRRKPLGIIRNTDPNQVARPIDDRPTPNITRLPLSPATCLSSSRLALEQFVPVQLLGQGGFGKVYRVEDKETGKTFALKVVEKASVKPNHVKLIKLEQRVLRKLSGSKGMLDLYASWNDRENFYMLTELCPVGDLRMNIKHGIRNKTLARFWIAELILALEALHARRIMHRDLKPDNILIDKDGHLVLADFGLAKCFKKKRHIGSSKKGDQETTPAAGAGEDVTKSPCGTPRYMAPELLQNRPYSYSSDVWPVGVILFMMICGRLPFKIPESDRKDQCEVVLNSEVTFKDGEGDETSRDLLFKFLQKDPSKRITLTNAKDHPYFMSINWDDMSARTMVPPAVPPVPAASSTTEPVGIAGGTELASDSRDAHPQFNFAAPSFRSKEFAEQYNAVRKKEVRLAKQLRRFPGFNASPSSDPGLLPLSQAPLPSPCPSSATTLVANVGPVPALTRVQSHLSSLRNLFRIAKPEASNKINGKRQQGAEELELANDPWTAVTECSVLRAVAVVDEFYVQEEQERKAAWWWTGLGRAKEQRTYKDCRQVF